MRASIPVAFLLCSAWLVDSLAQSGAPPTECPRHRPVARWDGCVGTFVDNAGGFVYSGAFRRGVFEGQGTMFDGSITYSGEFRDGRISGQGVLSLSDGRRYVGGMHHGMMEGFGRLLDADGQEIHVGMFAAGQPVSRAAQSAPDPAQPMHQRAPAVAQAATPAPDLRPISSLPLATPPAPTAPPPASPAPPPSTARASPSEIRDGVYLRTQFFGSQLSTHLYQVRGNRIAAAPRKVLGPNEFTRDWAAKVGSLRTEGDRVFIQWDGEKEFSNGFARNNNCPNFMGGITCRMTTFRDGERISGTFSGGASAGNVSSSINLTLNADGTYEIKRTGMVDAPRAGAISEGVERGRYHLTSNSSLTMQPDGGQPWEVITFPFPAQEPEYLWFGATMLRGKVERR